MAVYREFYDTFAPSYDIHMGRRTEHLVGLLPNIVELTGKRILDIGVGTADVWAELFRTDVIPAHVTGIDISPGMLELAGNRGLLFLKPVQGTVDRLPPYPRFDIVAAMGLLRHYGDPKRLAIRARQLLEPGGTFLVEDLSSEDANVRVGAAAGRALADLLPGEVRSSFHVPDEALREAVESAGFDLVRWEPFRLEERFGSLVEVWGYFLNETFLGWRIRGLPDDTRKQAERRLAYVLEEVLVKPVLERRFFVAAFERE